MWVAQDKIRYESVYLFICLLNKRAESSTTGAAYASVALDRSQEARPAGLDRAVEFVNSIETLPTSLHWYRARRSVLCARRSWRFGDRISRNEPTSFGHLKLVPDIDHFVKTRLFVFPETNRRLLVILN